MYNLLINYKDSIQKKLWETDISTYPRGIRLLINTLRLVYAVVHELTAGQLTLRAMSLVYTTLISLVPLLAVSFSVLKAFGVQHKVEPLLLEFLNPLGPKGEEIGATIIGFINNINVGVLGAVGLGVLFYTVVSLVQKIEESINHIWRIGNTRSFLRRIADYLSVLMIGPVMVVAALAVTVSMVSSKFVQFIVGIEPFGTLFYLGGLTVPYLLIIAAFTFMYIFIPNTSVKIGAAVTGATVSGILWKTAGMLFASFTAGSTKYDAIYSSFAILIMFMIWLYLSWLIFIMGSQIAFFRQYPEYVRRTRGSIELGSRQQEQLALILMYCIGKHYYQGQDPWTVQNLNAELAIPSNLISKELDKLVNKGLLLEINDKNTCYVPARDLDAITLKEVIDTTRLAEADPSIFNTDKARQAAVDKVLHHLDQAYASALGDTTLREWIGEGTTGA